MRSMEVAGYNSGYEIRQKEGKKYIEGIDYPTHPDGGREVVPQRQGGLRGPPGHGHRSAARSASRPRRPTGSSWRTT